MVAWCARWGAQEERAGGAVLQTLGTARARRRGHVCTVYGWGGVVLGLGPSCNGGGGGGVHRWPTVFCNPEEVLARLPTLPHLEQV